MRLQQLSIGQLVDEWSTHCSARLTSVTRDPSRIIRWVLAIQKLHVVGKSWLDFVERLASSHLCTLNHVLVAGVTGWQKV